MKEDENGHALDPFLSRGGPPRTYEQALRSDLSHAEAQSILDAPDLFEVEVRLLIKSLTRSSSAVANMESILEPRLEHHAVLFYLRRRCNDAKPGPSRTVFSFMTELVATREIASKEGAVALVAPPMPETPPESIEGITAALLDEHQGLRSRIMYYYNVDERGDWAFRQRYEQNQGLLVMEARRFARLWDEVVLPYEGTHGRLYSLFSVCDRPVDEERNRLGRPGFRKEDLLEALAAPAVVGGVTLDDATCLTFTNRVLRAAGLREMIFPPRRDYASLLLPNISDRVRRLDVRRPEVVQAIWRYYVTRRRSFLHRIRHEQKGHTTQLLSNLMSDEQTLVFAHHNNGGGGDELAYFAIDLRDPHSPLPRFPLFGACLSYNLM